MSVRTWEVLNLLQWNGVLENKWQNHKESEIRLRMAEPVVVVMKRVTIVEQRTGG